MKDLKNIITEKLRLDKDIQGHQYTCQPKTKDELRDIIKDRLSKDKNANLNDIDVSKITDMGNLFDGLDPHNIKIDEWDVSNVIDMYCMFYNCKHFNCDLSKWDVSNVRDMGLMFCKCNNFNCDLSKWDVSKVKNMYAVFLDCKSLKNIPDWYKK